MELAHQWESAIRQAWMPVTPQSSTGSGAGQLSMLRVPVVGETGHLGAQIRSEEEFSQLYQIFTDDLLGSGQFGTVYGGKILLLLSLNIDSFFIHNGHLI